MVDYALDALFRSLDASVLRAAIAGELGSLEALDTFVARDGRPDVHFRPAGDVVIISSDTTIGVAIPALAYAVCAKANVLVKDREDALVSAFVETLARERPELGSRIRVERWDGNDAGTSCAALEPARVVIAYGREETLRAIRARLHPDARFVGFGHRTSVGYVAKETLTDVAAARAIAAALATDALLYDGDGCLSIHVAFVERGGAIDPPAFARLVSDACDAVAIEFPASFSELDARGVAIRAAALFRAAQGNGAVFGGTVTPHLVLLDPDRDEAPPWARRTIALYTVDGPSDARSLLERHGIALEAVGVAPGIRPDVDAFAVAAGASRIAAFGTLQRPPLGGEHGGVGRILPFVRAIYR